MYIRLSFHAEVIRSCPIIGRPNTMAYEYKGHQVTARAGQLKHPLTLSRDPFSRTRDSAAIGPFALGYHLMPAWQVSVNGRAWSIPPAAHTPLPRKATYTGG